MRWSFWDSFGNASRLNPRSILPYKHTQLLIRSTHILQINNEKFAQLAGFSNPRSATNAWANIKKKLGFSVNTPKKETGTTAVKSGDDDDDDNEDGSTTPTPKKRKAPAKAGAGSAKKPRGRKAKDIKVEEEEDDEDAADFDVDDGNAKQEVAGADSMTEE